jgi:hypothetical protein
MLIELNVAPLVNAIFYSPGSSSNICYAIVKYIPLTFIAIIQLSYNELQGVVIKPINREFLSQEKKHDKSKF